jgi:hypothetical protein
MVPSRADPPTMRCVAAPLLQIQRALAAVRRGEGEGRRPRGGADGDLERQRVVQ